ncbi:MAG: polyphosphate polymerase domain-containing protein [Bacteroidaceae bacterium]|nr:polyphosphate polymerase domain-containing protein [Bacteroidaceae bacterium]
MKHILSTYEPITLEEMSGIRLMKRTDTKFVTTMSKLKEILLLAREKYRVQTIDDVCNLPYYTQYFDTAECAMFLEHQNGKKTRQKIRVRAYEHTGISFLEVKNKNNHGRTHKKRISIPTTPTRDEECYQFIDSHSRYTPESLTPQIENHFHRVTLVNKRMTERLTIDTDLRFHNVQTGIDCSLDQLVIIELKRDGNTESPIREILRDLRIHPAGFSKYCMGMALTNPTLKQNRFKPRLMAIQKMLAN